MTMMKLKFPVLFAVGGSIAAALISVAPADAAPKYTPSELANITFRPSAKTIVMTAKPLTVANKVTYSCEMRRQAKNSNAAPGHGGKLYRARGKGPALTIKTEELAPGAYNVFAKCDVQSPNLMFGPSQNVTSKSQRVVVR